MPLPKSASVAAKATEVYTEVCMVVMDVSVEPRRATLEGSNLCQLLPYLRQLLTCCACAGLLDQAMVSPSCGHCYCSSCQLTPPLLKIQCRQCRERTGLVRENHLRLVVECYRKVCTILATCLPKAVTEGEGDDVSPLMELVREVQDGTKVSRSILVMKPPEKYLTAKSSSHTCREEESPASAERENEAILLSASSHNQLEHSSETYLVPLSNDTTQTPPSIKKASKNHLGSPHSTGRRKIRQAARSRGTLPRRRIGKSVEPSLEVNESSGDERPLPSDVPSPMMVARVVKCRCGTNNPVTFDKICVRSKCPCFSANNPCISCHCRHCKNPFNSMC